MPTDAIGIEITVWGKFDDYGGNKVLHQMWK